MTQTKFFGGVNINGQYSFPNTIGTTGQSLVVDGSGNVVWANVSGGTSGTTSPAGSDTFIQFNDSNSFGANSGLTYDNTFNSFFTESKISNKTTTLTNGITNFLGQSASGASSIIYNNPSSGASAFTSVLIGDLTNLGGEDNQTFLGYLNTSNFESSNLNISLDGIQMLNYDPLAYQADLVLSPQNNVVRLIYDNSLLNTSGGVSISDSNTLIRFNDNASGTTSFAEFDSTETEISFVDSSNSGTTSFAKFTNNDTELYFIDNNNNVRSYLDLELTGINLKYENAVSSTGFYINDTQIAANFNNTGITQSFNVTNEISPSVFVKNFEVTTDGNVTINSEYTFPNTDGSTGQVLQTNGAGTVSWENPYIGGLFSQTGDSTTVSATTTETSIVGNGVGTLTVPANGFQVGDSFHAKIGGYISNNNNAELTIRLKSDTGTTLTTIGPITLPSMTNQFWEMEIDFTVRSTGSTANIQTNGQFVYIRNFLNNYNGYGFNTTGTFNTTVDNTLYITVEWDTNNASNAIMSDLFYLKKVY